MSIMAISQTLGSLGDEIGRELARTLSYELADREIILKAADRFGGGVRGLEHVTDEKPSLWERFAETERRYRAYIEAIVWDLAARDKVVLLGRGAPFILRRVRHCVRVRITASERLRATRVEHQQGFTADAAERIVRQSDRERGARIRFLYHVDWDDPLLYDLVVNTDRLGVKEAARVAQEALRNERFQPSPDSLGEVRDLSLTAQAQATLLADPRAALLLHPVTRQLQVSVTCKDGHVTLAGTVVGEELRGIAEEIVGKLPGVTGVRSEIVIVQPARPTYPV